MLFRSGGQLWVAAADGSHARQLTTLSGGASGPVWSPANDRVAFVSAVYPECRDDACNAGKAKAAADSKVKAHITDALMYRHWNAYDDGTRSHLFVVGVGGEVARDLMPGARYDVPPGPFGGSEGYAFAPDGTELAYTAKDQGRADAWTTDNNIYVVGVAGGAPVVVTAANLGNDQNPVYTADGRFIVYASQKRGGLESDRFRLMAYDRAAKRSRELAPTWDRWAEGYVASADGRTLLVQSGDRGRDRFFRVTLDASGKASAPVSVTATHNNTAPSLARDGRTVVWMRDAADRPGEVWIGTLGEREIENAHALTHENDAAIAGFAQGYVPSVEIRGKIGRAHV